MRLAVALLLLSLTGCMTGGPTAAEALADTIGPRVAGAPVDCIATSASSGARIIDRRTIVYRRTGTIYVNRLRSECPGLDPDAVLITEIHGGQLCRSDLISAVYPGGSIPGPKCQLGEFTPYRLPGQGPG